MSKRSFGEILFESLLDPSIENFASILSNDQFGHINKTNEYHQTLLMKACELEKEQHVEFLLKNHADISIECFQGQTALYKSLLVGNITIIKLLENNGADVAAALLKSNTFILKAFNRGNVDLIVFLYSYFFNTNGKNFMNTSPLSHCCIHGNLELLKGLLPHYRDFIDLPNFTDTTPLMFACRFSGRSDCAVYLIEQGANINYRRCKPDALNIHENESYKNHSIIEELCDSLSDSVDLLRLLIKHNVHIHDGCKALQYACRRGRLMQAQLLLEYGANNGIDNALVQAIASSKAPLVELLAKHGANVNTRSGTEYGSPLLLALELARFNAEPEVLYQITDTLLAYGAEIHYSYTLISQVCTTAIIITPYIEACFTGRIDFITLLKTSGAQYRQENICIIKYS